MLSPLHDVLALSALSLAAGGLLASEHLLVAPGSVDLAPEGHIEVVGVVKRAKHTGGRSTLELETRRPGGTLWVTSRGTADTRRGDVVHVHGMAGIPPGRRNPGAFDFAGYLRWRGINRTMRASSVSLLHRGTGPETVAAHVDRAVSSYLNGRSAALMRALLLGRTDELAPDLLLDFRSTGTVHVLAVSGLHVGFVILIAAALARVLGASPRGAILVALAFALAFAAVVGPRPSVVRAVTMAAVLSCARLLRRRTATANALGVAATALLLSRPGVLFDIGFQLSFGAVSGILVIGQPLITRLREARVGPEPRTALPAWVRTLGSTVAVSLGAQLGTLPVLLSMGTPVAPLATITNILVVPLAAFAVSTGAALCALHQVLPAGAHLVAAATAGGLRLLILCVETAARCTGGGVPVPAALWPASLVGVVGLAVFLGGRTRRTRALAAVLLIVSFVAACLAYTTGPGRSYSRVVLFDVGQGDSVLLEIAGGRTVLIDTGPSSDAWDAGGGIVLPHLRRMGVRKLDLVVLTHGHSDHVGGFPTLLSRRAVGTLVAPRPAARGRPVTELVRSASSAGVAVREVAAGETLLAEPACTLLVLWPPATISADADSENDRSIVLEARIDGVRILAGGDIEVPAEMRLCARGEIGRIDILKVAHHGSSTSSTAGFLAAACPKLAMIPVGRNNRFGHPDPEVIDRLERASECVMRTDRDGAVVVEIERPAVSVRHRTRRRAADGTAKRCGCAVWEPRFRAGTVLSGRRWTVYAGGPTTTTVRSSGLMISAAARRTSVASIDEMMSAYLES